jgi:hypothetical protein
VCIQAACFELPFECEASFEMCFPRDFAHASPFPRLQQLPPPQKIQKWRPQRRQQQQQQQQRRRCLSAAMASGGKLDGICSGLSAGGGL